MSNANLPATTTKTHARRRVQILATGDIYRTFGVNDDGSIYLDAYGAVRYNKGQYRFVTETETVTVSYAVEV